jgi:hypothetical protein
MRRPFSLIATAALLGFAWGTIIDPAETIARNRAPAAPLSNAVSIHGLHVALPGSLTNFPVELVPLP